MFFALFFFLLFKNACFFSPLFVCLFDVIIKLIKISSISYKIKAKKKRREKEKNEDVKKIKVKIIRKKKKKERSNNCFSVFILQSKKFSPELMLQNTTLYPFRRQQSKTSSFFCFLLPLFPKCYLNSTEWKKKLQSFTYAKKKKKNRWKWKKTKKINKLIIKRT